MLTLDTPLSVLPKIGPTRQAACERLGLRTVKDLLLHRPRRYIDLTHKTPLIEARPGDLVTAEVSITKIANLRTPRRGMFVTDALVTDHTSQLSVTWFNQPYLQKMYPVGSTLVLYGRITVKGGHRVLQPTLSLKSTEVAMTPYLPIYQTTRGLTSRLLAQVILPLLPLVDQLADMLPTDLLERYGLLSLPEATRFIHRPSSPTERDRALLRFAFNELLLFALHSQLARRAWQAQVSLPLTVRPDWLTELRQQFGQTLTTDQEHAIADLNQDLVKSHPMHRLLNGDVGSGKTIVAAWACLAAIKNGYQAAFMAPTQILAEQHERTLSKLFKPLGIQTALVTANRKTNLAKAQLIVGTHALLSPKVTYDKLAVVVVDEQHRFGVKQRQALLAKGSQTMPHLLSLTATPIPRTLALLYAGELDVSKLVDKPVGRLPVKTRLVAETDREKAYQFIERHLAAGFQAYLVVPIIESQEEEDSGELFPVAERASLEASLIAAQARFSAYQVEGLHGKLKPKDKQVIMERFAAGQTQLLVSTSVIEVGIDVQNATLMLIEDADRFGLAQLHQFRGRVGRGTQQSFCFLFTKQSAGPALERLRQFETINDGFALAETDLSTRGPGELFGTLQHGRVDLSLFSLHDSSLLDHARQAASQLITTDPTLHSHPLLIAELQLREHSEHLE